MSLVEKSFVEQSENVVVQCCDKHILVDSHLIHRNEDISYINIQRKLFLGYLLNNSPAIHTQQEIHI